MPGSTWCLRTNLIRRDRPDSHGRRPRIEPTSSWDRAGYGRSVRGFVQSHGREFQPSAVGSSVLGVGEIRGTLASYSFVPFGLPAIGASDPDRDLVLGRRHRSHTFLTRMAIDTRSPAAKHAMRCLFRAQNRGGCVRVAGKLMLRM